MNLRDLEIEFDVPPPGNLVITAERSVGSIIIEGAPQGERNPSLFRAICQDRRNGLPEDMILTRARDVNSRFRPPLSDDEIVQTVRSTRHYHQEPTATAAVEVTGYVPKTPVWAENPGEPHVSLRLGGRRICSPGNLSAVVSNPGSGKSSVCAAIVAARINPECDSLGFSVPPVGSVFYVDTELSTEDHWFSWARTMKRAGLSEGCEMPGHAGFYSLRQFSSVASRLKWILDTIRSEQPALMLIDGLGDLVANVNDPEASSSLVQTLLAAADQSNTAIVGTIHGNPSQGGKDSRDEKARGHLGSEVQRKAESVLMIRRAETGIRTITSVFLNGKNRNEGEASSTFQWDDGLKMMASCEPPEGQNPKPAKTAEYDGLVKQLREIRAYPWAWKELIDAIALLQGKNFNAAKCVHTRMSEKGLISHREEGWCVGEMPALNLLNW